MDIAKLQVIIETKGAKEAAEQISKMGSIAGKAESATKSLTSATRALGTATAVIGLSAAVKEAVKMADTYKLLEGRLSLVTKNTQQLVTAQTELFKIAQTTRQSLTDTIDLYTRIARSTQELGKTQKETLKVTDTINKSLIISGSSAESSKAALIQLGQGFASGTLRGEELNSVLEQTPRLAEAIAKGMGVTIGELRKLGAEGSLTGNAVFEALQKQAQAVDEEFAKMPKTVEQASTEMGNSLTLLASQMDKTLGVTNALSSGISALSKVVSDYAQNMEGANKSVFEIKTTQDFEAKKNQITKEIEQLQKLISDDDGWLFFWLDDRTTSEYEARIKRLQQRLEQLKEVGKDIEQQNIINDTSDLKDRFTQSTELNKKYWENLFDEEVKARKESNDKSLQLSKEWAERKREIAYNVAIAEQDELAKPYIMLQQKYDEDMLKFKGIKEAQIKLTEEYNAEVQRLNKDTVEKFNKQEEEKAKKSAEWQIKLFDANEKLNDQLIAQRGKMYGDDTMQIIEAWYQNQLEWLGKLALEGKATSEELTELFDKIEELRNLKIKEQTLSFKVETEFFDSFEDSLANSIEDAFNGNSLNLKSFYKNISSNLAKTISGSIANTFTGGFRSSGSLLGGLGALATGSAVSASEISSIMNAGGTFNEATNTISTLGGTVIKLGADGGGTIASSGSDIMSLMNSVSTLKTAYSVLSGGVSGTIASGFNSIASGLGNIGLQGTGTWLSQFGGGFASPLSNSGASALAGSSTGLGAVAGSAALGYGVGSIGDMLLGANTKAGIGGAIGGAIGSIVPGIGTIIGIAAGSLLGGLFGSKKTTDVGLEFSQNITSLTELSAESVRQYSDWKKKSWFSSKSGTDYSNLSSTEIQQIEGIFDTYDYLLAQLGDNDKIFLEAGKYSKDTFQDAIAKNFITAFTDISQTTDDTIYQAWVDYAESVDKTVIQALTESVNSYISSMRDFELWALNRSGQGIEALAKQAQWAQADFENLANTMGATGVTVDNFLSMYEEAVKNSFDAQTIAQWDSLGDALMSATDANKAYTDSIVDVEKEALIAAQTLQNNFVNSIQEIVKTLQEKYNPTLKTTTDIMTRFAELTGIEGIYNVKSWEESAGEFSGTKANEEALTLFGAIGEAMYQLEEQVKITVASLLKQGKALEAFNIAFSIADKPNYKDFTDEEGNFYANGFNVAYEGARASLAGKMASETSANALFIENAMGAFNDLYTQATQSALSEYGVLFGEAYRQVAYGIAEEVTGSAEQTQHFSEIVGITTEFSKAIAYKQGMGYIPTGVGIADLKAKEMQSAYVGVGGYSSRLRQVIYGEDMIAYDKTLNALDGALKKQIITTEEYTKAVQYLSNDVYDLVQGTEDLMAFYEDIEAQMFRAAQAQYAVYTQAVTSTEYYFDVITKSADTYLNTLKETGEVAGIASSAIGRFNSMMDVFNYTTSRINLDAMANNEYGFTTDLANAQFVKETGMLIAKAAGIASAEVTTADAKAAAERINNTASFSGTDATTIQRLSLMFDGFQAFDSGAFENTLMLINSELIKGNITQEQYADLFNQSLDIYRDVEQEQLNTLKSIENIVADISAYQRELLYGDLSTLSLSEQYAGAKEDTMGLYAQAKTALIGGDLDLFETLFNDFKGVSTNFLNVSKDFVSNNEAYVQDFSSVYGALADLKSLATTSGFNVGSDLSYLKVDGSHANGLNYVPYDGYIAELHKGERVQTASDARSTDALANEIRLLRQELKDSNQTIAFNTQRTAKILDRWDADGQPEERAV